MKDGIHKTTWVVKTGIFLAWFYFLMPFTSIAQGQDTFFLARKKGLFGRLGRSISTDENYLPVKTVNPFLRFAGKKIHSIDVEGLGFDKSITDTTVEKSFFLKVANKLHYTTRDKFIRSNLFFKENDYVIPLLLADNERFLRDQEFLQDAMIIVKTNDSNNEWVDIIVLTRDVFSLGGRINISSKNKVELEAKEENLYGTGSRLLVNGLYDKQRSPGSAFGAEFLKRNIFNRFLNARVGFSDYQHAILTGLQSQRSYYFIFDKPLVHRYKKWTGAFELRFNDAMNNYMPDSVFNDLYNYNNLQMDVWAGYNIGNLRTSIVKGLKSFDHFIALRSFYTNFNTVPLRFADTFNYNFANINGFLFSYNIFRQNFYRSNFIYGFGRNEDLPEGLSASLTAGWANKQGKRRNYYAFNIEGYYLSHTGKFYSYSLKGGAFSYQQNLEDIDLLIGGDHFTSLKKIGIRWRTRQFFGFNFAKKFRNDLSNPLFLQSDYGLPYFSNSLIEGQMRFSLKAESVFFNLNKFLGFRFAPFVFSDFTMITPTGESVSNSSGYSAVGGGFRTRNENLIFGTIEVKGYFFPRTTADMKNWRVDISTNVRFKYNSTFFKRPDFVLTN